jgi:hypothetical protein
VIIIRNFKVKKPGLFPVFCGEDADLKVEKQNLIVYKQNKFKTDCFEEAGYGI